MVLYSADPDMKNVKKCDVIWITVGPMEPWEPAPTPAYWPVSYVVYFVSTSIFVLVFGFHGTPPAEPNEAALQMIDILNGPLAYPHEIVNEMIVKSRSLPMDESITYLNGQIQILLDVVKSNRLWYEDRNASTLEMVGELQNELKKVIEVLEIKNIEELKRQQSIVETVKSISKVNK
uniref:hypothetical protein n=1 Tax=Dictyostelium intermedium TaxID=361076 RepID=UPI001D0FE7F1|nr:hypothetical protein LKZ32_mgp15 [Dictyostelium intermedium]DAZ85381.1 TPA_asm: hypothetical protein [Dictyostelium intermedium]